MKSSPKRMQSFAPLRNQVNYMSFKSTLQMQSKNITFIEFEVFLDEKLWAFNLLKYTPFQAQVLSKYGNTT